MGKEHTTIPRRCTILINDVTIHVNHPALKNVSHVCFTIYRGNKRKSIHRSELIALGSSTRNNAGTNKSDNSSVLPPPKPGQQAGTSRMASTSNLSTTTKTNGFEFQCIINYEHDHCYPMEKDEREAMIALQAVNKGVKRETLGTFFFDITELVHKPICKIAFVAAVAPKAKKRLGGGMGSGGNSTQPQEPLPPPTMAEVDCEIFNSPDPTKNDPPPPCFFEATELVEGQYVLPTARKMGSTIDNYRDLLLQKKGELLEKLSQKRQEKALKERTSAQVVASSGTAAAYTDPMRKTSERHVPPMLEIPPSMAMKIGDGSGGVSTPLAGVTTPTHLAGVSGGGGRSTTTSFEVNEHGATTSPSTPMVALHTEGSGQFGGNSPPFQSQQAPLTKSSPHRGPQQQPTAASENPSPIRSGPIVTTAQTFVKSVSNTSTPQLETVVVWNPLDAAKGAKVTMPSPGQLHSVGFDGSVVVVGRLEYVPTLLKAYLDELENRVSDDNDKDSTNNNEASRSGNNSQPPPPLTLSAVRLVLAGRDALVTSAFQTIAAEIAKRPRLAQVLIIPVRLGADVPPPLLHSSGSGSKLTSPQSMSEQTAGHNHSRIEQYAKAHELLDFFAKKCTTETSKGDFLSPPTSSKDQLALICSWVSLPTLASFTFPLSVVYGSFIQRTTQDDLVAAAGPSTGAMLPETFYFAKHVTITCAAGIDMVFYEPHRHHHQTSSSDNPPPKPPKKKEMVRDPSCVGVWRIPSVSMPFAIGGDEHGGTGAGSGSVGDIGGTGSLSSSAHDAATTTAAVAAGPFRPACVDAAGCAIPPRGSLPLRAWTTRSLEKGLTLDAKTHAPSVLQTSLYGKEVQKVVCSCKRETNSGGNGGGGSSSVDATFKMLLAVDVDGQELSLRASSVTIAEAGIGVRIAVL